MSIKGLADTTKLYRKSFHRINDSDEIDVFEAARYFSGYNETAGCNGSTYGFARKIVSVDVPMKNSLPQQAHALEKQHFKEKKHRTPSSPGGKLASFLNSLFSQTSSKKKKSKSTTQSMKDEDESPGGRRKRRSSISHFHSSSFTDAKSLYSSSSSGFRTPPPYSHSFPTKSCKEFRSYSENKQGNFLSKHNGNVKSATLQNELLGDKRNMDLSWLDDKFKLNNGLSEKLKNVGIQNIEKDRNWVGKYPSEEKEFRKFNELDDGAESDSSSDLFELQNYDLGIYSSGLPVYETTNMDSIKKATPISTGTM